jgi:hypothetical protein
MVLPFPGGFERGEFNGIGIGGIAEWGRMKIRIRIRVRFFCGGMAMDKLAWWGRGAGEKRVARRSGIIVFPARLPSLLEMTFLVSARLSY